MLFYRVQKITKSALLSFVRLFSFGTGISKYFPWVKDVGEWLSIPPKAPKDQVAKVEVGDVSFQLHVSYSDANISARIFANGVWEKNYTHVLEKILRKGDVFLDLGANIGYYSILAGKKIGADGRVFAFEPAKDNFELLCQNIKTNGLEEIVHPIQKAAGESQGKIPLYAASEDPSDRIAYAGVKGAQVYDEIECVRPEDYLRENYGKWVDRIRVIKMDIEGFEPFACKGMERLLKKKEVILFAELNYQRISDAGTSVNNYLKLLKDFGFHFSIIDASEKDLTMIVKPSSFEALSESRENHLDLLCQKS